MAKERKNFIYGDRTNFTIYFDLGAYRCLHSYVHPLISGSVERAVKKYGFVVDIESVQSESGNDLSHLAF